MGLRFKAHFSDGHTARLSQVDGGLDQGIIRLYEGNTLLFECLFTDLTPLEEYQTGKPLRLTHPTGAVLATEDKEFISCCRVVDKRAQRRKMKRWIALLIVGVGLSAIVARLFISSLSVLLSSLVPSNLEVHIGDRLRDGLIQEFGECTNKEIQKPLEKLARELAAAGGYQGTVEVRVLTHHEVNALALPGGRIMIFSGLLEKAREADEVAGVLAHEVSHVVLRHPVKGFLRHIGIASLSKLILGDVSSIAVDLGTTLTAFAYSRSDEKDADREGVRLLHERGYRSGGLLSFFRESQKEGDTPFAILSTHPSYSARADDLSDLVKEKGRRFDMGDWKRVKYLCSPSR